MADAHRPRSLRAPSRRSALMHVAAGVAGIAGFQIPARAADKTLRLASTLDLSGAEKANGGGLNTGALAYLGAVNNAGGVNGNKVELLTKDDGFKPDVAKANAVAFEADRSILAILHPLGTRQAAAVIDTVPGMAVVGPSTGTVGLRRKPTPNAFWTRANYDQEIDKLIETAATLGTSKIGLVHSNDPLGQSLLAAFNTSTAKFKLTPSVIGTTPGTTSPEVGPAAEAIAKAAPQVVIIGLAGTAPLFVKALREAGATCTIYGLSITASANNIRELGDLSRGFGFSLIVPSPFASKNEIVRRYQADMQAAGSTDYSLPSLEGYINARVLVEALRRSGPNPTREAVLLSLAAIDSLDLGGVRVGFGKGRREGNSFVDVAVIGAGGRMIS